jgi:hypothetical protein
MRMLRCAVSVVLALGVLLTQFAALGHAHCGAQPAGHDARPHFHAFGHAEHREARDSDEPAFEPFDDHDADANYLSGTDTIPAARAAGALCLEPLWWAAPRALAPAPCAPRFTRAPRGPRHSGATARRTSVCSHF